MREGVGVLGLLFTFHRVVILRVVILLHKSFHPLVISGMLYGWWQPFLFLCIIFSFPYRIHFPPHFFYILTHPYHIFLHSLHSLSEKNFEEKTNSYSKGIPSHQQECKDTTNTSYIWDYSHMITDHKIYICRRTTSTVYFLISRINKTGSTSVLDTDTSWKQRPRYKKSNKDYQI